MGFRAVWEFRGVWGTRDKAASRTILEGSVRFKMIRVASRILEGPRMVQECLGVFISVQNSKEDLGLTFQ